LESFSGGTLVSFDCSGAAMQQEGRVRLTKRDGCWVASTHDPQGREVEVDTGSADLPHAYAVLGGLLAGKRGNAMTVTALESTLVRDYTLRGRSARYIRRAKRIVQLFAQVYQGILIRDITAEMLAQFAELRLKFVAHGSVKVELAILHHALRLYHEQGYIDHLPSFPCIKPSEPRIGFLEDHEIGAICTNLPPELRGIIWFLSFTGWRVGEARQLTWKAVDFANGIVRLEPGTTKNKDGREFPFKYVPPLEKLLQDQREIVTQHEKINGIPIPWVFFRWSPPRAVHDFYSRWDNACATMGRPGAHVHDLRRSAVRRLELAGVPRRVGLRAVCDHGAARLGRRCEEDGPIHGRGTSKAFRNRRQGCVT
jgi:integrase